MTIARGVLFAMLGLVTRCLGNVDPLRAPTAGGEPWQAYDSEHFELFSDLKQRDALSALAEFEHVYDLLAEVTMHGSQLPSFQTQVVVFRNMNEASPFLPPSSTGVYLGHLPNEPNGPPTLLVSGTLSPFGRTLFAHELAHRFNFVALGETSTWMNEGLAQYYSTIRGELEAPIVGESDPENVAAAGSVRGSVGDVVYEGSLLHVSSLPSASTLVRMDRTEFYGQSFDGGGPGSEREAEQKERNYAASWMLIHMLMHSSSNYAVRFRELLAKPDHSHTGDELDTLLRQVDPTQLDAELSEYLLKSIPWREAHLSPRKRPAGVQLKALSDSEVLTLWARLDAFNGPNAPRARQRLQDAVKADPKSVEALLWLAHFEFRNDENEAAEQHLKTILALSPRHRTASFALLELSLTPALQAEWSTPQGLARRAQLASQLEGFAESPKELTLLAAEALIAGDAKRAGALADRAWHLDGECMGCLHVAAAANFELGNYPRALELEQHAFKSIPEDAKPERRDATGTP